MTELEQNNLKAAIKVVLNARDMCGNEAEALKEFCYEENLDVNGSFGYAVMEGVRAQWGQSQKEAGVKTKYRVC